MPSASPGGSAAAVRLAPAPALTPANVEALGWDWLFADDAPGPPYLAPEWVVVPQPVADRLYLAGNELFSLAVEAVDHVLAEGRLGELGVPPMLHEAVRHTWHDERHLHLFGRFDLACGLLDHSPVHLIEFNADTPTGLPEAAILQWLQAEKSGAAPLQYNALYERLVEQFGRWKALNADLADSSGTCALGLVGFGGEGEDWANLRLLGEAAREAGFTPYEVPIAHLVVSRREGAFAWIADDGNAGKPAGETVAPGRGDGRWVRLDFIVKLVPWEQLADPSATPHEHALLCDLVELILERRLVVANPPYALALQSKRLLAVLWERFPGHPLLLEAARVPLAGQRQVEKPAFSREGASLAVYAPDGSLALATEGDYARHPTVFQAWTALPHDAALRLYQCGLFWSFESCALAFRRTHPDRHGGQIVDDRSTFVGHVVET